MGGGYQFYSLGMWNEKLPPEPKKKSVISYILLLFSAILVWVPAKFDVLVPKSQYSSLILPDFPPKSWFGTVSRLIFLPKHHFPAKNQIF